jgi:hypothetical protein
MAFVFFLQTPNLHPNKKNTKVKNKHFIFIVLNILKTTKDLKKKIEKKKHIKIKKR